MVVQRGKVIRIEIVISTVVKSIMRLGDENCRRVARVLGCFDAALQFLFPFYHY